MVDTPAVPGRLLYPTRVSGGGTSMTDIMAFRSESVIAVARTRLMWCQGQAQFHDAAMTVR
jgi:hypothetical protein